MYVKIHVPACGTSRYFYNNINLFFAAADHKRAVSKVPALDSGGIAGGYATNFGASMGGAGPRGIEGQIIASCFKGLVTRFAKIHKELKLQDNTVRSAMR